MQKVAIIDAEKVRRASLKPSSQDDHGCEQYAYRQPSGGRYLAEAPHAVWKGVFTVGGIKVRAYTLSDGRRVVDADDMMALLTAMAEEPVGSIEDYGVLGRWVIEGPDA